jgi:hypothetical protein
VVWHYPDDVSATTSAFKDIPSFCFPDLDVVRLEQPLSEACRLENFTFTLTDQDGGRVYGVCLRFLPPGEGQRFGIQVSEEAADLAWLQLPPPQCFSLSLLLYS